MFAVVQLWTHKSSLNLWQEEIQGVKKVDTTCCEEIWKTISFWLNGSMFMSSCMYYIIYCKIFHSFVLWHGFKWQILETEGVAVPEEVPSILQLLSEYLKEPCPITSLSGSQGPTHPEGLIHPGGDEMESNGRREAHQVSWLGECTGILSFGGVWM